MRALFGQFELTLDEKNRLLVPSDIRKAWNPEEGDALVIVPGVNEKLWVYTEKFYEGMAQQLESKMSPGEDKVEFDLNNFARANRIELDKAGRMLIPDYMVKEQALDREVMVLGARDHFEIWNRSDWHAWQRANEQRRREKRENAARVRVSEVQSGSATVGGSTLESGQ